MVTKTKSGDDGISNNNNININIDPPKRRAPRTPSPKTPKKTTKDNRTLKVILFIATLLIIYYFLDSGEKEKTPENLPRTNPIEGTKQN